MEKVPALLLACPPPPGWLQDHTTPHGRWATCTLFASCPPSPCTARQDTQECGICYVYRLEAAVPDRVCDNPKCCRPYHTACLVEWLRAIPAPQGGSGILETLWGWAGVPHRHYAFRYRPAPTRQSFDTLFGECVYCQHSITVKVPGKPP